MFAEMVINTTLKLTIMILDCTYQWRNLITINFTTPMKKIDTTCTKESVKTTYVDTLVVVRNLRRFLIIDFFWYNTYGLTYVWYTRKCV